MPTNDPDEWMSRLATDVDTGGATPQHERLHAAAVEFLAALRAIPPGDYRSMAECKFGDCVMLAYVAARP